jgi:hypothetical protein
MQEAELREAQRREVGMTLSLMLVVARSRWVAEAQGRRFRTRIFRFEKKLKRSG